MTRLAKQTIVCHAGADTGFARELGAFLDRNCLVAASYEPICTDLLDAVERATSGDLVLAVLSPFSVPQNPAEAWKRERWEPVLFDGVREFGTEIAFLLASACKFPELLRRKNFFDCSKSRAAGFRRLKRRLLEEPFRGSERPVDLPDRPAAELAPGLLERLNAALGDKPGIEEGLTPEEALAFACASVLEFEGVFWLHCGGRSRCGILGDIAHALGLRLTGSWDENHEALREFCQTRRCLLVFADLDAAHRELVNFGGKASVIVTADFDRLPLSPRELIPLFAAWPKAVDKCTAALSDALAYLPRIRDYGVAMEFGSAIAGLLKSLDRLSEADEVLEMMAVAARRQGDPLRAHHLDWERSWIADSWGRPFAPLEPRHGEGAPPTQLDLFPSSSVVTS